MSSSRGVMEEEDTGEAAGGQRGLLAARVQYSFKNEIYIIQLSVVYMLLTPLEYQDILFTC